MYGTHLLYRAASVACSPDGRRILWNSDSLLSQKPQVIGTAPPLGAWGSGENSWPDFEDFMFHIRPKLYPTDYHNPP